MTEDLCYLCMRITAKDVFQFVHKVFSDIRNKELEHKIAQEAVELIRYSYTKNPAIFCGKTKIRIIGGLVYYLGVRDRLWRKSQPVAGSSHWEGLAELSQNKLGLIARELWGPAITDFMRSQICLVHFGGSIGRGYKDWRKLLKYADYRGKTQ